jgi:hypothetical protein
MLIKNLVGLITFRRFAVAFRLAAAMNGPVLGSLVRLTLAVSTLAQRSKINDVTHESAPFGR